MKFLVGYLIIAYIFCLFSGWCVFYTKHKRGEEKGDTLKLLMRLIFISLLWVISIPFVIMDILYDE